MHKIDSIESSQLSFILPNAFPPSRDIRIERVEERQGNRSIDVPGALDTLERARVRFPKESVHSNTRGERPAPPAAPDQSGHRAPGRLAC
jgi:hypothetical protein